MVVTLFESICRKKQRSVFNPNLIFGGLASPVVTYIFEGTVSDLLTYLIYIFNVNDAHCSVCSSKYYS